MAIEIKQSKSKQRREKKKKRKTTKRENPFTVGKNEKNNENRILGFVIYILLPTIHL